MGEKVYYWIKLKDHFFDSDDMKVVRRQANGAEYVIFWQQLLLKAISQKEIGLLRYKDKIPYNPDILATVTDTNIDIVKAALKIFLELNMIEIKENGDIWIDEVKKLVGSETGAAERMRQLREKKKDNQLNERNNVQNVTSELQKSYVEKEIEKEIDKKEQTLESRDSSFLNVDDNKCRTYLAAVKGKKRGTVKYWCNSFRSKCDRDDKFCMGLFNKLRRITIEDMNNRGMDTSDKILYGILVNKTKDALSHPDSWLYTELKSHYKSVPDFLKNVEIKMID